MNRGAPLAAIELGKQEDLFHAKTLAQIFIENRIYKDKEFEESRKAHWISFASDAGVLIGGFVLRLLILLAALPITMVVPWV